MSKETRYRNVMHHRQYPLDVFSKVTVLPACEEFISFNIAINYLICSQ
jgi:hypothetical protein